MYTIQILLPFYVCNIPLVFNATGTYIGYLNCYTLIYGMSFVLSIMAFNKC